uniref:Uncharacterized protein n=1 Tax=Pseudomonas aeruginosa TaxID=287 RepID=A0A5P9WB46_PSEAI|nr:hypothetical protein pNK546KPC_0449 [Pseudomonas aeruginosa]
MIASPGEGQSVPRPLSKKRRLIQAPRANLQTKGATGGWQHSYPWLSQITDPKDWPGERI